VDSYAQARRIDPYDATISKILKTAEGKAQKQDKTADINSCKHFGLVFSATSDTRLRLATLATFWNLATLDHRWQIFKRFLRIVAGPRSVDEGIPADMAEGPHISHFTRDVLTALPMANYADVTVPRTWMLFFQNLAETDRVEVFNTCWELCTDTERGLIIQDVRTFFVPGGPSVRPVAELEDAEVEAADSRDTASVDGLAAARSLASERARLQAAGMPTDHVERVLAAAGSSGRPLPLSGKAPAPEGAAP
jgi:hypothetical protein